METGTLLFNCSTLTKISEEDYRPYPPKPYAGYPPP